MIKLLCVAARLKLSYIALVCIIFLYFNNQELFQGSCTCVTLHDHSTSWRVVGIISVGFDVRYQLLIRTYAFVRYWIKNGTTMR
jgi:hypothetical protein